MAIVYKMNCTIRKFKVCPFDDYRIGKYLAWKEILENPPSDSEDSDDPEAYREWSDIEFNVPDGRYHVFYFAFEHPIKLLRSFDSRSDAELYVKQQYKLVAGDYPFVKDWDPKLHRKGGSRPPIPMDNAKREVPDYDDDCYEYLFVIHPSEVKTYVLRV